MVEAVFFNLDDTLTKRTKSYQEIYDRSVEDSGIKELEDEYSSYQEEFFRYFKQNFVFPRRQAVEQLLKEKGIYTPEKVECFVEAWEEAESDAVQLKEGAIEVLEEISKDFLVGIASNGTGRLQRLKIEKLGIEEFVDSIIVASEIGYSKPERGFFEVAKKSLGDASRYFIVSHLPKTDIIAGKQAGLKPIWINENEKEVSDDIAVTVKDIREVVEKLEQV